MFFGYYIDLFIVFFAGFIAALFFVAFWVKRRNEARAAFSGDNASANGSKSFSDDGNPLVIKGDGFSGKRRNDGAVEHLKVQVGDSTMYIRVEDNADMSMVFTHKKDREPFLEEKGISFVFDNQGALCKVEHLLNGHPLRSPQIENVSDIKL